MSALVTSDLDEDWYTNSRAWSTILECAADTRGSDVQTDYGQYVNSIGVDFTIMEVNLRAEVANWLLAALERLQGPLAKQYGWDTEHDHAHLQELLTLLRGVVARNSGYGG